MQKLLLTVKSQVFPHCVIIQNILTVSMLCLLIPHSALSRGTHSACCCPFSGRLLVGNIWCKTFCLVIWIYFSCMSLCGLIATCFFQWLILRYVGISVNLTSATAVHLDCFHILTLRNISAVSIHVQVVCVWRVCMCVSFLSFYCLLWNCQYLDQTCS